MSSGIRIRVESPPPRRNVVAERVVEVTDQVYIDHGEFMLLDWDGGNGQAEGGLSPFDLADQARSSGAWFLTSGNVAFIVGEYGFHKATVFLERWDGEPPRDEGWAKVVDATMFLSSSVVYVTGSGFPPSGRMLNLQALRQEWNVRASVRPLRNGPTDEYPPDNIEEFRMQFWHA
ncbi:hypothetical protein ABZU75_01195 [Streptosporangium sp. NPDC005286]|uniref:hypothetical protein n=1 Tax=Streptosporangium sp. NPDC005286 TaxID=3154463 RepID=UPI0033B9D5C4